MGGLLAHLCTVALIGLAAAVDVRVMTPRQEPGAFQTAARQAGAVVGPTLGTLTVFLFGFWVARRSTQHPHRDGTLVGALAALIMVPLVLGAAGGWRLVYVGSMLLKVMGGWSGGAVAARGYSPRSVAARTRR